MREYLHQSSQFDAFPYDAKMYKFLLRQLGAKRIREAFYMGWNNQPRVVTWEAGSVGHNALKFSLSQLNEFSYSRPIIIQQKNW